MEHVKSKNNYLADPLSRLDFKTFWDKAPLTMNEFQDTIDEAVWPVYNIWDADI